MFCAGADLKAVALGDREKKREPGGHDTIAPMGPSRLRLNKPVIAAVEGHAVAGGMELALWADMRVVGEGATFGIFCRRFGVPLIDMGTIRLPRLIGHSRAMDLILTGRPARCEGSVRYRACQSACSEGRSASICGCARAGAGALSARLPAQRQALGAASMDLEEEDAINDEMQGGLGVIASGETLEGAKRFASGQGRHGSFT